MASHLSLKIFCIRCLCLSVRNCSVTSIDRIFYLFFHDDESKTRLVPVQLESTLRPEPRRHENTWKSNQTIEIFLRYIYNTFHCY